MVAAGNPRAGQIKVRQVDPFEEGDAILAVLRRNLPSAGARERLEWLYRSNPDGPALVWLAQDPAGVPVGTSAAHPRRMRVDGSIVRAINLGDFAMDRPWRTLGPALQLLRATLEPVRNGAYAFSYDYPSPSMDALYTRMDRTVLGYSERWVRPVSLKTAVRRHAGEGVISDVVGAAADVALWARDALIRPVRELQLEVLSGPCGEEFDALDARLAGRQSVIGVRDATYLNWRYLQHTMWRHTVICARRHGRLDGYMVLRSKETSAVSLLDLHATDDESVRHGLVAAAVHWARDQNADSIDVEVVARSASARMVQRLGFLRREPHCGPVACAPEGPPYAATLSAADNWWLMGGDRDV
jgi:hypothetical protein